jgi:hypothetical protein
VQDCVAAPVVAHPIFRHDTSYAWLSSSDFSGLHDLTETLLAMDPSTADRATPDSYRRERSERRPPLIVAGLVIHVASREP